MSAHKIYIERYFRHGRKRPFYKAGCKCGWRALEEVPQLYVAENEYKDHRFGPVQPEKGRDLMDRNLKEIHERNQVGG